MATPPFLDAGRFPVLVVLMIWLVVVVNFNGVFDLGFDFISRDSIDLIYFDAISARGEEEDANESPGNHCSRRIKVALEVW